MQDLHRDAPACGMDTVRDDAVVGDILRREQTCRTGENTPLAVGGHAARHHQPDAATGARGVEFGHAVPVAGFLQPGVHRPHQHAVLQRDVAQRDG